MIFRLCRPIQTKPNTLSLPIHSFQATATRRQITRGKLLSLLMKTEQRNHRLRLHDADEDLILYGPGADHFTA